MSEYIDNKKFQAALLDYKRKCEAAEAEGRDIPPASNYIGECFILLCNKIATRWNFVGYSYKDEMVLFGIEICVRRIRNYDPDKYNNPFGYFSRVVWRTFGDIIKAEHLQAYFRAKLTVDEYILADSLSDIDDTFGTNPEESATANPYFDWVSYEKRREEEREEKRKPKTPIEVPENALF